MTLQTSQSDAALMLEPEGAEPESVQTERVSTVSPRRLARVLQDGLRFGKYQVVRLVAIGGMSEIYEAIHVGLKKRVALKVMRPDLAENAEARQRFVSEGINAARIRHSNVVDVTDVGVVDELPYLVMALLEGEDLGMVYDRQGRLPVNEVVDLLLPVASAVAVGHAIGIVHRDLKPDNIYLHREGCRVIPKVLDFGVSRVMSARRITLNASVLGTPHYMSPEQARGATTDARTDQYALGVILYEGVTGRLPRDSANPIELLHLVAYESFLPPSEYFELPRLLEAVILRAMAGDPEERFPSMRELAIALVPFASEDARDYWSVELGMTPVTDGGATVLASVARNPSRPPGPPARPSLPRSSSGATRLASPAGEQLARVASAPSAQLRAASPPLRAFTRSAELSASAIAPRVNRRRRWIGGGLAVGGLLFVAGGGFYLQRIQGSSESGVALPETREAAAFRVELEATPPTAAILLDGSHVAVGRYQTQLPRDGRQHQLRVIADGFDSQTVDFRDEPPPARIELVASPNAPRAPALNARGPALAAAARRAQLSASANGAQSSATTPAASSGNEPTSVHAANRTRASVPGRPVTSVSGMGEQSQRSSTRTGPQVTVVGDQASAGGQPSDRGAVIGAQAPRVRIVDEAKPRVRLIE